jgi:hypothetical protein
MHLVLLILLPTFAVLTKWQLGRALDGNSLSWAYTFEWPLFGVYAVYVWWQLIHDQRAPTPRRGRAGASDAADPGATGTGVEREPGWALTGGRQRNVAIARATAIDPRRPRGERLTEQTAEEAAALEEYNRYLARLAAEDAVERPRAGARTAHQGTTTHQDAAANGPAGDAAGVSGR